MIPISTAAIVPVHTAAMILTSTGMIPNSTVALDLISTAARVYMGEDGWGMGILQILKSHFKKILPIFKWIFILTFQK